MVCYFELVESSILLSIDDHLNDICYIVDS